MEPSPSSANRGNIPRTDGFAFLHRHDRHLQEAQGQDESEGQGGLLYAKEKVDKAQGFIEAMKQRQPYPYRDHESHHRRTAAVFQDGDEADLKPMILKDVADRTGSGHQYHLPSEQREVRPDQMGHLPTQVLLHRWLHHRGWRRDVNP